MIAADYRRFQKDIIEKQRLMREKELICRVLPYFENQEIAEHDVRVMEEQADRRFQENCDLQDYVAKWCHELKTPLAAAFLMNEKIADTELRITIQEQLEKMNQQIHTMLLGCRLQSPLVDLQLKRVEVAECVRQSVGNHRFFLIQKGFELTVEVGEIAVYTDPSWLVYIVDQLISNAVKYKNTGCTAPRLCIRACQQSHKVRLSVEDNGEGIKDSDIGRIFEKGYTGSNYHNGKYKSTGMGLYMVSQIADKLGHEIQVESQYGVYTKVTVIFKENPYFLRSQEGEREKGSTP